MLRGGGNFSPTWFPFRLLRPRHDAAPLAKDVTDGTFARAPGLVGNPDTRLRDHHRGHSVAEESGPVDQRLLTPAGFAPISPNRTCGFDPVNCLHSILVFLN